MTKTAKLLKSLQNGNRLTVNQIRSKFNLANPRAAISNLSENYSIIATPTKKNDGTVAYSMLGVTAKKSNR